MPDHALGKLHALAIKPRQVGVSAEAAGGTGKRIIHR